MLNLISFILGTTVILSGYSDIRATPPCTCLLTEHSKVVLSKMHLPLSLAKLTPNEESLCLLPVWHTHCPVNGFCYNDYRSAIFVKIFQLHFYRDVKEETLLGKMNKQICCIVTYADKMP